MSIARVSERRGENHRGRGGHRGKHGHHRRHGAQTFRRGRAIEFLERLQVRQATLKQQLEAPEFREIKSVLLGELKAVELILDEYVKHFELRESEDGGAGNEAEEAAGAGDEEADNEGGSQ